MMTPRRQRMGHILKSRLRRLPNSQKGRELSLESIPENVSAEFLVEDPSMWDDQLRRTNLERRRYGRIPFQFSSTLQKLAQKQATAMAQMERVFHSVLTVEELKLNLSSNTVAENVQRGDDIASMHEETMASTETINRSNVLSPCFNEFGSGCTIGQDGKVYVCQLFRKS